MIGIWEAVKEIFGFSKQVAENQGQKIPMKQLQIEAKANKNAGEINEDSIKDDWVPKVLLFSKCLSMRWEHHAVNQVRRLIDAGSKITSIQIEKELDGDMWLYIRYTEGLCKTYYRVPVRQNKAEMFIK